MKSLALNANELRLRSRSRYGRVVGSTCVPPPRRPAAELEALWVDGGGNRENSFLHVVDRAEAARRHRKEGTGSVCGRRWSAGSNQPSGFFF